MENEQNAACSDAEENRAREWLDKRCPGNYVFERRPDGGWQATVISSAFGPGGVPLSKLGSFVVLANDFFRAYCL